MLNTTNRGQITSAHYLVALAWLAVALLAVPAWCLTGNEQFGIGPVNQSMGGAGTAAFLDATGVLAWNPAGSRSLEGLHIDVSLEAILPDLRVSSSVAADSLGAGFPAFDLSGATSNQQLDIILPAFAMTYHSGDNPWALHAGMLPRAGLASDLPLDPLVTPGSNAILTGQSPTGFGLGRVESEYAVLEMPVGLSYRLTDNLDIGISAMPSLAWLKLSPAGFAAPDDANGDGFATYPTVTGFDHELGLGVQAGVVWRPVEKVALGASFASPIWFGDFEYDTHDENGGSRAVAIDVDAPAILSCGASWQVLEGTLLAIDLRGIFFSGVAPFDDEGYNADGSVAGLGWNDVFAVGVGVQQSLGKMADVRLGYHYSENPIPDRNAFFNVGAVLPSEHHLTTGMSLHLRENLDLTTGFYYAFANSIEGPYVLPSGPVAGTSVRESLSVAELSLGLSMRF